MITQNNNPNPSRKGFQKNEFLQGRGVYCCLVKIDTQSALVEVTAKRPRSFRKGVNLFFSPNEKEIYNFYRVFDDDFYSHRDIYAAVYAPNSECETENT